MRLTPLDIRKQEFRKAMRGLDAEEVYAFLSTVGDEYEAILNDNTAFKERLLELDDKVQEYRSMEKNLRNTLLTAERVTVEAKDSARREASLIIKEAQIEAEKALRDIKTQAMKLRQEVSQLRNQRESYLGRMKVIAESLLKFIESVETDFNEEDDAFQAVLAQESASQDALLADAPAENGDLFEDANDET
ncbi:MAG: DivIVA domain-containing protein, partial [Candidatus Krumholzibacteria bacterium]|nr:DivIVA domain-containing protein [Candidatus Krumholzibacteria bacterium]